MAGISLSLLISEDLLPPYAGLTVQQLELSTTLADAISDRIIDAEAFSQRSLLMLDPEGTCTGLAWRGDQADGIPLLCQFLDSVGRFSVYRDASFAPLAPVLKTVLTTWTEILRTLSTRPAWQILDMTPATSNPFLHFQLRIAKAPAYLLVAAPLHRGICAKAHTLKDRPGDSHHAGLAEYAGWTVHIVEEIPSERIKDSLADYAPGEWDAIIQETITGLKKVRTLPGDSSEYRESSRSTLASDWQSVFFALSGNRESARNAYSIRKILAEKTDEPELLLSDSKRIQSVLRKIHDAESRQDSDWLRGTIKVCRQLQERAGKGLSFSEPKTRSGYRTIKVGETTLQELQKHRQRMDVDKMVAGKYWSENNLVFPSTRGTPFGQENVRKDFISLLDTANLPRIRIHDLRHTAASLMLNHGIPVIVVSRRLGHSNASVTLNIYAHTTVDMQNEAASLMDELITPIPVNIPQGELTAREDILVHHLHPIAPDFEKSKYGPPISRGK